MTVPRMGPPAIIERFAQRDPRIRWWRNPKNLGIGGNFNAPLKAARAQYIKYMLHDDKFLVPTALGRLVETLDRDATVSLVVSAAQLIDGHSRPVRVRNSLGRTGGVRRETDHRALPRGRRQSHRRTVARPVPEKPGGPGLR